MGHPRRDGIIALCRSESALGKGRIVVAMNQVVNDAGMICVLFPQLFEDGCRLELLRQTCVSGRGVTYTQHSERVEGLDLEIVRILIAKLMNGVFVRNHTI